MSFVCMEFAERLGRVRQALRDDGVCDLVDAARERPCESGLGIIVRGSGEVVAGSLIPGKVPSAYRGFSDCDMAFGFDEDTPTAQKAWPPNRTSSQSLLRLDAFVHPQQTETHN